MQIDPVSFAGVILQFREGNLVKSWDLAATECVKLIQRLHSTDPLVIDYFIDHNRDLEDIAKLCIAWVILEREFISLEYRGNENRRQTASPVVSDNWCRFILHKLTAGCPDGAALLSNNVTFVTLNYDVSLEIALYDGLRHSDKFVNYAEQFIMGDDRILHVYGRLLKDPPWHPMDINWETFGAVSAASGPIPQTRPPKFWADVKSILDHAYEASQSLQIIAPAKAVAENSSISDHIQKARKALAEAECVYILGYGFDELNSRLLQLPTHLNLTINTKTVMFTNYNNSGVVNKSAARLFLLDPNVLLPEGGRRIPERNSLCEKSVKDVYGALAFDFDSPEERPRK